MIKFINMAIHVRTNYYWIEVPEAYESKANDLAFIAGLSKRLNRMDIYNQARNTFLELYNRWEREGRALAKKESNTNWLGGGSEYLAKSMMPWEFYDKLGTAFAEVMPLDECAIELKKALSEL